MKTVICVLRERRFILLPRKTYLGRCTRCLSSLNKTFTLTSDCWWYVTHVFFSLWNSFKYNNCKVNKFYVFTNKLVNYSRTSLNKLYLSSYLFMLWFSRYKLNVTFFTSCKINTWNPFCLVVITSNTLKKTSNNIIERKLGASLLLMNCSVAKSSILFLWVYFISWR